MDTLFMNSENSKTSDPHRLLLHLPDKLNLKRSDKHLLASSNLRASTIQGKLKKIIKKKKKKKKN